MKRTQIEKMEREQKKKIKKSQIEEKKLMDRDTEKKDEGYFIKTLYPLFQYDETDIYNISFSEKILELVMEIQETIEEKSHENIFRKSIKKTKIKEKEKALHELKKLME